MKKNSQMKNAVKNLCLSAFALILCGLFYACNDEQQASNPNLEAITGKFLNQEGNPVAGIIVEATDANGNLFSTDTTDASGFFKIQNVPNELTNGIVNFVNADGIIHQEKLERVVNTINTANASGKVGNVFQGGDNDCETVFKLAIKDAETQLPIQDANVRLGTSQNAAFNKTSDVQGIVFFENIAPGRYNLRVAKTDYQVYEDAFLLLFPEGTDTLSYTIYLNKRNIDTSVNTGGNDSTFTGTCCTNSVKFYLMDYDTREKVANGNVALICINPAQLGGQTAISGRDGLVVFNGLCEGQYVITNIRAGGYAPISPIHISVRCGENQELEPVLLNKFSSDPCCNSRIVVYVQDSVSGTRIANVPVKLWGGMNNGVQELQTNRNGEVIFDVCEGEHKISIQRKLGTQEFIQEFPVTVTCDTIYTLVIYGDGDLQEEKDCKGSITLTIFSDTLNVNRTNPVAEAKVYLHNSEQLTQVIQEAITDANGVAKFTNLPKGTYDIYVKYKDEDSDYEYTGELKVILGCNQHYQGTFLIRKP